LNNRQISDVGCRDFDCHLSDIGAGDYRIVVANISGDNKKASLDGWP
tara:strand:- start:254 stop:394 length:141 start_codon:yes stop_codon:yes gene_type:complete